MNKVVLGKVRGDKGEQGPQGLQGIQGLPGIRGSRWVCGTAISGIFTDPRVCSETGITDALVNDQYLNSYEGNIYRCCTAGDANTATWVWTGQMDVGKSFELITGNSGEWKSVNDTWDSMYGVTRVISLSGQQYYVAVGEDGTILTSSNGTSWTSDWSGNANLYDVAADDKGTVVAVGNNGITDDKFGEGCVILHSQGLGWQDVAGMNTLQDFYALCSVAYGNGRFVAVGGIKNNPQNGTLIYSEDGVTWHNAVNTTDGDVHFTSYYQVKFCNNRFVAVGYLGGYAYSVDGVNWVTGWNDSIDENLYSITYHNGAYVAAGANNTIVYSENAQDWTLVDLSILELFEYRNATCVTFIDGKFTVFFDMDYDNILVSADGKNGWYESIFSVDDPVRSVYQGNEKCLITAGYTIYHTDVTSKSKSVEEAINEIYAFLGIRN